ncbi:class II aldolase/adducin family protein [Gordonia polyisoprenivorans]|uniref:class II aldolase/adducin family protein n=1 Tax=Gordonia polyisoprenivorans TaxID=84595 RepID=UPI001B8B43D6|nr:class II aldolase/adducin family protein [Gordonia polyisoprenivorans]QUD84160.1 class II aldolase/adducin family protein [Gordonia polyisoprenivorans]
MDIDDQRAYLCAAAHQLASAGHTIGTGGNLSARVGDHVLVTPSGCRLDSVSPEQLVVVDLDGTVAVPTPYRPTSELRLHLDIYRTSSTAAVAHAHPIASVAVGNIVDELPAIHYTAAMLGGSVRVAPYAVFGSPELSTGINEALFERTAALMRNHGAIAVGSNIETACEHIELLEWLCEVYLRSVSAGTPAVLDENQLTEVVATAARRHYTPFPGRER